MKRYFIAILSVAIFTVACKKSIETIVEPSKQITKTTRSVDPIIRFNNNDYLISNGMMNFTTFTQYENLFEVLDANNLTEFAYMVEESDAMQSYNEVQSEELKQNFIGSIVNDMGLIKIDVYTILLDFNSRIVYATRTGTAQDLLNAKMGNIASFLLSFSMDANDVIEELIEHKTRGILCNERWAASKNQWTGVLTTSVIVPVNVNATLQANVKYSSSGIYFELQTESYCPQWANIGNTGTVVPRSLYYSYSWERRCGTSGSGSNTNSCIQSVGAVNNRCRIVIYGNVRALKHYSLSATISSNRSIPASDSKSVSIAD